MGTVSDDIGRYEFLLIGSICLAKLPRSRTVNLSAYAYQSSNP